MAVSLRRPLMSRNGERVAPFTTPEQQPLDIFSFVLIHPSPPFQPSRSATHAQM